MDELFYKIEKQTGNLSELEEVVFRHLRSNPEIFAQATLDEISAILFVSTATISRTIKKLGFKSFQELKFVIQQSLEDTGSQTHSSNRIQVYKDKVMAQLETTFDLMDNEQLDHIIEKIYDSRAVEIYSVGATMPIGIDLCRKFLSLGKKANAFVDWDDLLRASKIQGSDELAIVISLSGETRHLIEFAEKLKEREVPILAIVGTADSKLESFASYTLFGPTTMNYYHDADISSRLSLVAITELVVASYSEFLHKLK